MFDAWWMGLKVVLVAVAVVTVLAVIAYGISWTFDLFSPEAKARIWLGIHVSWWVLVVLVVLPLWVGWCLHV